jgi:hypothetical protein
MEEITKEWPAKFLVPVEDAELSDPNIIESPLVTWTEYDGQSSAKKKKKKEELQDIDSEDKDNASEETVPDSPTGGEGNEVNQEEEGEEDKRDKGEVTPSKDPLTTVDASQKRNVSPEKPSARKKTRANKPQSQNVLTVDDIQLIITAVEDTSEDILQRHEAKKETLYKKIEKELKDIKQALYSSHAVSTTPSSSKNVELGYDPTQLRRLVDATEVRHRRAQEEEEQATEALKQEKEEALEKLWVVQQDKDDIRMKFEEDREKI